MEYNNAKDDCDMESQDDHKDNQPIEDGKYFTPEILKDIWKPFLISMKLFALSSGDIVEPYQTQSNAVKPASLTTKGAWGEKSGTRWQHRLGLCLCLFIFIVMTTLVAINARELVLIKDFEAAEARLVILAWCLLCVCQQLTCLLTTTYRTKKHPMSRFQKFVKTLMAVKAEGVTKHKRNMFTTICAGYFCILVNTVVLMCSFYIDSPGIKAGARKMYFGSTNWAVANSDALTISYTVFHIFFSGCWVIPVCYYFCLCQFVAGCFNNLFERTELDIDEQRPLNILLLRREYVRLCHVISALDHTLSPLAVVTFALYIPQVILNINGCIHAYSKGEIITGIAFTSFVMSSLIIIMAVSIAGAQANGSSERLSEILYDIDASKLDKKSELELMLLISNVSSGQHAQLTVGGVVTIDREMIITIFGTIIAYTTLLIQFK